MCNNYALIAKAGNFQNHVLSTKVSLLLGRSKGAKGTGVMHNGRRRRSRDVRYNDKNKWVAAANHDSLQFIESLIFHDNSTLGTPEDYHIFMGHNRAPSHGMGAGQDFVHPFEYGESYVETIDGKEVKKLKNRMWFQHNGTIKNPEELATAHGLKFSDYKNDSFLIGSLIYMGVDPKEIFIAYEGACTCIWYWEKTKTLQVFKGGTELNYILTEERPLYMYKDDNQIMFNTQEVILDVVKDFETDGLVTDFPINEIHTIDVNLNVTIEKVDRKEIVKPPKPSVVRQLALPSSYQDKMTFPDDRDAFNQVVWYDGLYYLNQRIVHGVYSLSDRGILDKYGNEYVFSNGIMLENEQRFYDILQSKGNWFTNWYHPRALHRNDDNDLWYTGKGKGTNKCNPILFYNHDVSIYKGKLKSARVYPKDRRKFVKEITPYSRTAENTANYNMYNNTDFPNYHLCMADYCKKYDIDNIYLPKYKRHRLDFINICEGKEEMLNDPICNLYNDMNDTKWLTRFQCQEDFFTNAKLTGDDNEKTSSFNAAINMYLKEMSYVELFNSLV